MECSVAVRSALLGVDQMCTRQGPAWQPDHAVPGQPSGAAVSAAKSATAATPATARQPKEGDTEAKTGPTATQATAGGFSQQPTGQASPEEPWSPPPLPREAFADHAEVEWPQTSMEPTAARRQRLVPTAAHLSEPTTRMTPRLPRPKIEYHLYTNRPGEPPMRWDGCSPPPRASQALILRVRLYAL